MKKNQLPKQVLNTLLAYQIKSDDILDVCPFDLSFDSEYISGYLFLTSTKIGVAKSRHEQMTVRYFRGTKTADMQYAEDEKEYMLEWFDLADTSHMRVEKQLATNLVTIDYKGKPLLLAALTNLYFEQMNLFRKSYNKDKKISRGSRRSGSVCGYSGAESTVLSKVWNDVPGSKKKNLSEVHE